MLSDNEQIKKKIEHIIATTSDKRDKQLLEEYMIVGKSYAGKEMMIEKILDKYPDIP